MKRKTIIVAFALAAIVGIMAGCAPKTASPMPASGESSEEPTVEVAFSMDGNCETCHVGEAESTSDGSCLASMHADADCTACHADAAQMEKAHEKATVEKAEEARMAKTSITSEDCVSCHDVDEIKAATVEATVLTDENGTTVNPHDLPSTHLDDYITCVDCHSMHESADTGENAVAMCKGCHHKDVYECNTCH